MKPGRVDVKGFIFLLISSEQGQSQDSSTRLRDRTGPINNGVISHKVMIDNSRACTGSEASVIAASLSITPPYIILPGQLSTKHCCSCCYIRTRAYHLMAPVRRYLRITKYSVLEVRIYLDNPAAQPWLLNPRDDVLSRIFQAIRPFVLPKLREEHERAKGSRSKRPKGVKDTVVEGRNPSISLCRSG